MLRDTSSAGKLVTLRWQNFTDYNVLVQLFYSKRQWSTAWVDGQKPSAQALAMISLFKTSDARGLRPEDYDSTLWDGRIARLKTAREADRAKFDIEMTVNAMRFVSNLRIGRVNPQHFSFGINVADKKYDLAQFLAEKIVGADDLGATLAAIEPQTDEFRKTVQALANYRQLATQQAAQDGAAAPLPMVDKPLRADAAYAGAERLRQRLQLLGDLPADSAGSGGTYDRQLAAAVKTFQARHGLNNDGQLSPRTIAVLNVPLSTRIAQLEDSLERWRWLSDTYLNAPLLVNLPEFALRAYNDDHTLDFVMGVIVGDSKELDHQTPLLAQKMRYLVMRPYWTVTTNIVKKEIVPHVEADKGYLEAKNFEVVDHSGKPVENWKNVQLEHGTYMVREKPGPTNSLGLIKFMFPNKYNIYLHSTPAVQLFNRTRRDFSHGCVRVSDPEKLAAWVLRNQPEWDPDKIHDAMENGPDNHTVLLKTAVPVLIFYATAFVDEDGTVRFFDDLYGYDKDMEGVLAQGPPYPVKPEPKPVAADTE